MHGPYTLYKSIWPMVSCIWSSSFSHCWVCELFVQSHAARILFFVALQEHSAEVDGLDLYAPTTMEQTTVHTWT